MDIEAFLISWESFATGLGTLLTGIATLWIAMERSKKQKPMETEAPESTASLSKALVIIGILLIVVSVPLITARLAISEPLQICSPDCTWCASEIKPIGYGYIGIYEFPGPQDGGQLLKKIKVTQHPFGENKNDIKRLVWSSDSKWLAVMYHHDGGGHISIIDVDMGREIKYIPISKWYRSIEFSSDKTKIIADGDVLEIIV